MDSGNDLYKGMKKDSRKLFDDLIKNGRKFVDKIPMVKKIEEGVGSTLQSIPSKLNLPDKKDMDDLAKAIKVAEPEDECPGQEGCRVKRVKEGCMHKIKRYANRKLYDTTDKKYITLDGISESGQGGKKNIRDR